MARRRRQVESCATTRTGGRPKKVVDKERLEKLVSMGFSLKSIASQKLMGDVGHRTLTYAMKEFGLSVSCLIVCLIVFRGEMNCCSIADNV